MVNSQEIMASMIFLLNLITAFFILPMNDVILVWVIYWNACLCFYIETYNYLSKTRNKVVFIHFDFSNLNM
jgi:hypothetical protein